MQISATHEFPQPVEAAFAMLLDPEFLDAVCAASDPVEYWVFSRGLHTGARRVMRSPDSIKRLAGPTLTITDEIEWASENGDGTRTGATAVRVEGMPVKVSGRTSLTPRQDGSALLYTGELQVAIPLLGPSLERQAAPLLLEALAIQAQVAQSWG